MAQDRKEYYRQYAKDHPRDRSDYFRQYENSRQDRKEYFQAYDKAHPDETERRRESYSRYRKTEAGKMSTAKNRHRRRSITGYIGLKIDEWKSVLSFFNNRCAYCGKPSKLNQEHFVPVSKGGTYSKTNIIPACRSCNSKKCDKDPVDFISGLDNGLSVWAKIQNYFASLL
jgi:5-methylcytosine-specific restriction endonuclease McrA